jgi:PAS domain S-box-containing protein
MSILDKKNTAKPFFSAFDNYSEPVLLLSSDFELVYANTLANRYVIQPEKFPLLLDKFKSGMALGFEGFEIEKLTWENDQILLFFHRSSSDLSTRLDGLKEELYAVWALDSSNKLLFFNDLYKKISLNLIQSEPYIGQSMEMGFHRFFEAQYAQVGQSPFFSSEIRVENQYFEFYAEFISTTLGDILMCFCRDISHGKQSKQQLAFTKLMFETMVDGLPKGLVLVVEKDLTYSFIGGELVRQYNLKVSDFLGKKIGILTSGEAFEKYQKAIESAFLGQTQSIEISLFNKGLFFQLNLLPLHENGRIDRVLIIAINISEQKLTEKKYEERELILSKWFNNNVIGNLIWSIDGSILEANPAFLNMLGYSHEELEDLKINDFQITSANTFDSSRKALEKLLSGEPHVTYQKEYISKDSRIIPVEVTVSLFEGRMDRGFSYIRNLSEIKQAHNQLKLAESLYAEAISMQQELVLRILLDGTIVYANPSFCRTFLSHSQNFMGLKLEEAMSEAEFNVFDAMISTVLESKKNASFEDSYQYNSIWISWNLTPVLIENNIVEIQCIGIDISHIKWAEAKILEQNKLLKENNLRLEKINSDLDSLVSKVSHDLRSPLSSIRGIVDVATIVNQNPDLNTYFDLIKSSVKKLEEFISDFLDLAKSSNLKVTGEEINLNSFFTEVFDTLRFSEGSERVEKRLKIDQQIPFYSDRQRLFIIFSNLVSNSIRYSNPKANLMYVSITAKIHPNYGIFEVQDNGLGIEEKHQSKVFDMFYRANDTKTGTGLGLFIVKEAVEKLSGIIELKSVLGEGTTFTLKLPNLKTLNKKRD